jgi:hypothetical protein
VALIFIVRGGLAPLGVKTLTKLCQNITPNSDFGWTGRSNRLCDVQIIQKLYLPPDSELDVPYMDLDLLDENYPMVESKLPFEDFY